MAINHPNAKNVYFTWEGPWGAHHMVLVIVTDLHLNPQHPAFDLNAVNGVIGEANRYVLSSNRQIDHFRLVSVSKDQVE
jgi:hypothetical protein